MVQHQDSRSVSFLFLTSCKRLSQLQASCHYVITSQVRWGIQAEDSSFFSTNALFGRKPFPEALSGESDMGPLPGGQHIYYLPTVQEQNSKTSQTDGELSKTAVPVSTHPFGFPFRFTSIDTAILISTLAIVFFFYISFHISSTVTICLRWKGRKGASNYVLTMLS